MTNPHARDDQSQKLKYADPTPDQAHWNNLLLLALHTDHVGHTLESWACYVFVPVMHLGLSIMPFPGYMRVACPDITVHHCTAELNPHLHVCFSGLFAVICSYANCALLQVQS